jgi:hypothetical protein
MKVVCINKGGIKSLTEGKKYKVVRTNSGKHNNSDKEYNNIWVINDFGIERNYSIKRFISVPEWRDNRLKELGI